MNKDSDNGFVYCNDDMLTVYRDPTDRASPQQSSKQKCLFTFSTIQVLEYKASVTVHRLYALSAGVGWST